MECIGDSAAYLSAMEECHRKAAHRITVRSIPRLLVDKSDGMQEGRGGLDLSPDAVSS
jgi:hypothetical protein